MFNDKHVYHSLTVGDHHYDTQVSKLGRYCRFGLQITLNARPKRGQVTYDEWICKLAYSKKALISENSRPENENFSND